MEEDIYSFAREHGLNERKVVDVSSGICPCGPSKKVRAAVRKAVRDIRFLPDPSLSRVRKTIASKLHVDGGSLIFANRVEELLYLIIDVFRPDRVLAAGPLLDSHADALFSSGANAEYLRWRGDNVYDLDGSQISAGKGGLVFISQPNRITGRLAESGWLNGVFDVCGRRNSLVVVDESLIEFTGDPGSCGRAAAGQGVIILRSTVNFYGLPGLGLAYAVSSPGIIDRLTGEKRCEVSTLASAAARAAIKDKTYGQTAREYVAEERKFLVRSLEKLEGFSCHDSDSNVLLVKATGPAAQVSAVLARQGFLIRTWKSGGSPGETFFRVSIMQHERNVKFVRLLKLAIARGGGRQ